MMPPYRSALLPFARGTRGGTPTFLTQRRALATPTSSHIPSAHSDSVPLSNLEQASLPYPRLQHNLNRIRQRLDRPLTLSEKILFSHLYHPDTQDLHRGKSSLQIRPDRAACHDATATMAMLQFISAGLPQVALPTSIHSDHLIVAEKGNREDLEKAKRDYAEVSAIDWKLCLNQPS